MVGLLERNLQATHVLKCARGLVCDWSSTISLVFFRGQERAHREVSNKSAVAAARFSGEFRSLTRGQAHFGEIKTGGCRGGEFFAVLLRRCPVGWETLTPALSRSPSGKKSGFGETTSHRVLWVSSFRLHGQTIVTVSVLFLVTGSISGVRSLFIRKSN
jgi:hypothetical protein